MKSSGTYWIRCAGMADLKTTLRRSLSGNYSGSLIQMKMTKKIDNAAIGICGFGRGRFLQSGDRVVVSAAFGGRGRNCLPS